MSSELQIANLLYTYAEHIDSGRIADAAALFEYARIRVAPGDDGIITAEKLGAILQRTIVTYADGSPRTKHVVTNPIIEVNEIAGTATARSYYTVFQQTDDLPLQPIVAGRYHDEFQRVAAVWRWSFRDYTPSGGLMGNLSKHNS